MKKFVYFLPLALAAFSLASCKTKAPESKGNWNLIWNDEFDGTELSEEDWNYEEHEVGWVNHELQEYVPSSKYAFVKDGELIIQPTKEVDAEGNVHYTSGRVNTQGKHDIKL